MLFFDVELGTGLSSASNYEMTSLFVSGGLSYNLPLQSLLEDAGPLSNLNLSLGAEFIEVFNSPQENGTTDVMNFGLSVGYPILF